MRRRSWFQPELLVLLCLGLATRLALQPSDAPADDERHAAAQPIEAASADETSTPPTDDVVLAPRFVGEHRWRAPSRAGEPAPHSAEPRNQDLEAAVEPAPKIEHDATNRVDSPPPAESSPPTLEVISRQPLLVDVDDDRIPELIAVVIPPGEPRPWLVAVSLVHGRSVWSMALDGEGETAVTFIPPWDHFLVHDRRGLHAIARADAEPWWHSRLLAKMTRAGVDKGQIRVVDDFGLVSTIGRDGSVKTSSTAVFDAKSELPIDMPPRSWLRSSALVAERWQAPSAAVAELDVRAVYCGDLVDPPLPAAGEGRARCPSARSVGLAVVDGAPKIVGFRSARGGTLDWAFGIVPSRPLGIDEIFVDVRHSGDDGYVAFYEEGREVVDIARFSVKSGQLRWASQQGAATGGGLELSGDDDRLVIHTGGTALVLEKSTGHHRLCLGAC